MCGGLAIDLPRPPACQRTEPFSCVNETVRLNRHDCFDHNMFRSFLVAILGKTDFIIIHEPSQTHHYYCQIFLMVRPFYPRNQEALQ